MFNLSDFRIGWRQLLADPVYSAIVILGLGVALASSYLIMSLLFDALLPDPALNQPERLVALDFKPNIPDRKLDWTGAAPFVLRDALISNKAPVGKSARVFQTGVSMRLDTRALKVDTVFADPELVDLFGLHSSSGDLAASLSRPDSLALSEVAAERIFGQRDVLGKKLTINGKSVTVGAILPRPSGNSMLQFEALAGFNSILNGLPKEDREGWYALTGRVYAQLAPGANATQLGDLLQNLFDHSPVIKEVPPGWIANGRKAAFLRAMPMDKMQTQGAGSSERNLLYGGLAAAALAMLALAAVNYVNLTTVRTLNRQREIGVRKSLGASPGRLAGQLITESVLVALLAGAFGLLLAALLAGSFADLLNYRFDNRLFSVGKLLALVFACIALGVVTGFYPARIALNINCAESLSGRSHSENASGRWVRRGMTTLQFAAAIMLSAMALVILWQSHYVSHMDNGFRSEGLLTVSLPASAEASAAQAMHDALAREAGVQGVAFSDDVPGRNPLGQQDTFTTSANQAPVLMRLNQADVAFFQVYQIPLLAGKLDAVSKAAAPAATPAAAAASDAATPAAAPAATPPAVEKPVVLDRTAAKALGFANLQAAIGASIKGANGQLGRVVAVSEKVRQESARSEAAPQVFFLENQFGPGAVITLRSNNGQLPRKAIEQAWQRHFPNEAVTMDSVDNYLAEHYKQDRMTGILIAGASAIALVLASLGVYSLAAYTVRIKTREIVIRKLHGAGNAAIAGILVRELGLLLGVGLLLGLPVAWIAMAQYLGGYVEHAPVGIWPLLAAVLATALMAALAGLRHAMAALALRPILALQG